jgi:hypothetical protein
MELVSFWKLNLPKYEETIDVSSKYRFQRTLPRKNQLEQWPKTRM